MMDCLEHWTVLTRGIFRYVIAADVCYEIQVCHWDYDTDILTAKACLYLSGSWGQRNGNHFFERECLLSERPVFECIEAAIKDDKENNNN